MELQAATRAAAAMTVASEEFLKKSHFLIVSWKLGYKAQTNMPTPLQNPAGRCQVVGFCVYSGEAHKQTHRPAALCTFMMKQSTETEVTTLLSCG